MPAADTADLEKLKEYAQPLVESGDYASVNAVLTAAMNALHREAEEHAQRERLLAEIQEGEDSGLAEGDVLARVLEKAGLSTALRG